MKNKIHKIHIVRGVQVAEGIKVDPNIPYSDFYENHTVESLKEFMDEFITEDKQSTSLTRIRKMLKEGNTFCFLCDEGDGKTSMYFMQEPNEKVVCEEMKQ